MYTKVYSPSPIDGTISVFRMPLYFFLSGLFFKTYEGFSGFLKRKINVYCGLFTYGHPLIEFMRNTYADHSPITLYSCGLAGLLGVIFTAKMIHKLPLISYWGRYSIMILVTHMPIIPFYIKAVEKLHLEGNVLVAVTSFVLLLSYLLYIPLMKKFIPHVTAQRDVIRV